MHFGRCVIEESSVVLWDLMVSDVVLTLGTKTVFIPKTSTLTAFPHYWTFGYFRKPSVMEKLTQSCSHWWLTTEYYYAVFVFTDPFNVSHLSFALLWYLQMKAVLSRSVTTRVGNMVCVSPSSKAQAKEPIITLRVSKCARTTTAVCPFCTPRTKTCG